MAPSLTSSSWIGVTAVLMRRPVELLLLPDHLHADIAVQVAGIDIRLRLERQDVFLDVPRLVEMVRVLRAGRCRNNCRCSPGRATLTPSTSMSPAKPNDVGSVRNCGSTRTLQAIVLQEQVELGDRLVLVAVRVIHARLDAAEEVADTGTLKSCLRVRSPDASVSLMCGDFMMPFGTVAAPAARSPSETWLASA